MQIALPVNRILICSVILFFTLWKGSAQDIHFSQYFNSPLSLNPSHTGNFPGDWRVSANYRSQWKEIAKPYLTESIGFDKQFYLYNEKLSGGIYLINDKSAGSLRVMKIMLSAAYHKTIYGHELHGGVQVGYVGKSFNINDETFPNQFSMETGQFDNTKLTNNETSLFERLSYVDLNLGFGWNKKVTAKLEPFLSVAFFHTNYPHETFLEESSNRLTPRKSVSGGVRWELAEKVTLVPSFIWMENVKAAEFIVGSNLEFMLEPNKNPIKTKYVYGGIHLRTGISRTTDAGYVVVGLKHANYNVALSYDINVSNLHIATNYRGAFEVAFIYTGISTRLTKTEVPCDRY